MAPLYLCQLTFLVTTTACATRSSAACPTSAAGPARSSRSAGRGGIRARSRRATGPVGVVVGRMLIGLVAVPVGVSLIIRLIRIRSRRVALCVGLVCVGSRGICLIVRIVGVLRATWAVGLRDLPRRGIQVCHSNRPSHRECPHSHECQRTHNFSWVYHYPYPSWPPNLYSAGATRLAPACPTAQSGAMCNSCQRNL